MVNRGLLSVMVATAALAVALIGFAGVAWDRQFLGFPHTPEADDPALYATALADQLRRCRMLGVIALAGGVAGWSLGWPARRGVHGRLGLRLALLCTGVAAMLFAV